MIGTANRNDYVGNASTATYSYAFLIFAATDLFVAIRDTNDVEVALSYPTHYSVTGVGVAAGGTVVLAAGSYDWLDANTLKTGYALVIRRVRPVSQQVDIRNQAAFYKDVIENAFDHLVMVDQQQQDALNRSLHMSPSFGSADFNAELPKPTALGYLRFNSSGDAIEAATAAGLASVTILNQVNLGQLYLAYTRAYSATPTFDLADGTTQTITLTGNVTSSTFSKTGGLTAGDHLVIRFIQDATGGRTFTFPTNVLGANGANSKYSIDQTALCVSRAEFQYNGANWELIGPVVWETAGSHSTINDKVSGVRQGGQVLAGGGDETVVPGSLAGFAWTRHPATGMAFTNTTPEATRPNVPWKMSWFSGGKVANASGAAAVDYYEIMQLGPTGKLNLSHNEAALKMGDAGDVSVDRVGAGILGLHNFATNPGELRIYNTIGLVAATAWSGATAYVVGDLASRLGIIYHCHTAHSNQQPPNSSYWTAVRDKAAHANDYQRVSLGWTSNTFLIATLVTSGAEREIAFKIGSAERWRFAVDTYLAKLTGDATGNFPRALDINGGSVLANSNDGACLYVRPTGFTVNNAVVGGMIADVYIEPGALTLTGTGSAAGRAGLYLASAPVGATANYGIYINGAARNYLGGSLGIGEATVGTGTPTKVLVIGSGTAPTSSPADSITVYSSDDAAGHTIPSFYLEGTNVLATGQADSASSVRVKMRINGTIVTLLAI